jgi:hypothetical protein
MEGVWGRKFLPASQSAPSVSEGRTNASPPKADNKLVKIPVGILFKKSSEFIQQRALYETFHALATLEIFRFQKSRRF